ncbi:MAG: hypothetical protein IT299_04850 [Dehalococcoidia bacterium]|nr:hypothetical protein [Dehalococcoidia bacterium]
MTHRLFAGVSALVAAALPVVASAAEEGGRVLERPDNFTAVFIYTAIAAGGVLFLASLGRLYQLQRGLHWRFQDPDVPHDDHH